MNKPSRKILVTGVAGFLGSHLSEKLSELKRIDISYIGKKTTANFLKVFNL